MTRRNRSKIVQSRPRPDQGKKKSSSSSGRSSSSLSSPPPSRSPRSQPAGSSSTARRSSGTPPQPSPINEDEFARANSPDPIDSCTRESVEQSNSPRPVFHSRAESTRSAVKRSKQARSKPLSPRNRRSSTATSSRQPRQQRESPRESLNVNQPLNDSDSPPPTKRIISLSPIGVTSPTSALRDPYSQESLSSPDFDPFHRPKGRKDSSAYEPALSDQVEDQEEAVPPDRQDLSSFGRHANLARSISISPEPEQLQPEGSNTARRSSNPAVRTLVPGFDPGHSSPLSSADSSIDDRHNLEETARRRSLEQLISSSSPPNQPFPRPVVLQVQAGGGEDDTEFDATPKAKEKDNTRRKDHRDNPLRTPGPSTSSIAEDAETGVALDPFIDPLLHNTPSRSYSPLLSATDHPSPVVETTESNCDPASLPEKPTDTVSDFIQPSGDPPRGQLLDSEPSHTVEESVDQANHRSEPDAEQTEAISEGVVTDILEPHSQSLLPTSASDYHETREKSLAVEQQSDENHIECQGTTVEAAPTPSAQDQDILAPDFTDQIPLPVPADDPPQLDQPHIASQPVDSAPKGPPVPDDYNSATDTAHSNSAKTLPEQGVIPLESLPKARATTPVETPLDEPDPDAFAGFGLSDIDDASALAAIEDARAQAACTIAEQELQSLSHSPPHRHRRRPPPWKSQSPPSDSSPPAISREEFIRVSPRSSVDPPFEYSESLTYGFAGEAFEQEDIGGSALQSLDQVSGQAFGLGVELLDTGLTIVYPETLGSSEPHDPVYLDPPSSHTSTTVARPNGTPEAQLQPLSVDIPEHFISLVQTTARGPSIKRARQEADPSDTPNDIDIEGGLETPLQTPLQTPHIEQQGRLQSPLVFPPSLVDIALDPRFSFSVDKESLTESAQPHLVDIQRPTSKRRKVASSSTKVVQPVSRTLRSDRRSLTVQSDTSTLNSPNREEEESSAGFISGVANYPGIAAADEPSPSSSGPINSVPLVAPSTVPAPSPVSTRRPKGQSGVFVAPKSAKFDQGSRPLVSKRETRASRAKAKLANQGYSEGSDSPPESIIAEQDIGTGGVGPTESRGSEFEIGQESTRSLQTGIDFAHSVQDQSTSSKHYFSGDTITLGVSDTTETSVETHSERQSSPGPSLAIPAQEDSQVQNEAESSTQPAPESGSLTRSRTKTSFQSPSRVSLRQPIALGNEPEQHQPEIVSPINESSATDTVPHTVVDIRSPSVSSSGSPIMVKRRNTKPRRIESPVESAASPEVVQPPVPTEAPVSAIDEPQPGSPASESGSALTSAPDSPGSPRAPLQEQLPSRPAPVKLKLNIGSSSAGASKEGTPDLPGDGAAPAGNQKKRGRPAKGQMESETAAKRKLEVEGLGEQTQFAGESHAQSSAGDGAEAPPAKKAKGDKGTKVTLKVALPVASSSDPVEDVDASVPPAEDVKGAVGKKGQGKPKGKGKGKAGGIDAASTGVPGDADEAIAGLLVPEPSARGGKGKLKESNAGQDAAEVAAEAAVEGTDGSAEAHGEAIPADAENELPVTATAKGKGKGKGKGKAKQGGVANVPVEQTADEAIEAAATGGEKQVSRASADFSSSPASSRVASAPKKGRPKKVVQLPSADDILPDETAELPAQTRRKAPTPIPPPHSDPTPPVSKTTTPLHPSSSGVPKAAKGGEKNLMKQALIGKKKRPSSEESTGDSTTQIRRTTSQTSISGSAGPSTPVAAAGRKAMPNSAPGAGLQKGGIVRSASGTGLAGAAATPVKPKVSKLSLYKSELKEKGEMPKMGMDRKPAASASSSKPGVKLCWRTGRPEYTPTAAEIAQYEASAPQREADRLRRAEWKKTAVNLQASQDGYKLDRVNHNKRPFGTYRMGILEGEEEESFFSRKIMSRPEWQARAAAVRAAREAREAAERMESGTADEGEGSAGVVGERENA